MLFLYYIDKLLEEPFQQIENIMSNAYNLISIQQMIADHFALALLKHLHEQIERMTYRKRGSSEEKSITGSVESSPIDDNTERIFRKKKRRFLIKNFL